jgi:hypothetical protein
MAVGEVFVTSSEIQQWGKHYSDPISETPPPTLFRLCGKVTRYFRSLPENPFEMCPICRKTREVRLFFPVGWEK